MKGRQYLPSLLRGIEDMQGLMGGLDWENLPGFSTSEPTGLSVYEDEQNVYIEAAMPGIKPEEIQVNFDKGVLWIKGEPADEKKDVSYHTKAESAVEKKDVKYHVKASKTFSYRVAIPSQINENKEPEAVCKDGILTITFSKSPREVPRKILVKAQ